MKALSIESLREGLSGIIPSFGGLMADCAIFSLASQGHRSGVKLDVVGGQRKRKFTLHWKTILGLWAARSMNDETRTTEFGAMGLGILLSLNLTSLQHFTVARKPSGIDFWLFENEPHSLDFSTADARLEISGIARESGSNNLRARFLVKKEQVSRYADSDLPTWIALVEFSVPQSLFARV